MRKKKQKIVTVDVKLLSLPKVTVEGAILLNRSMEYLLAFEASHPGCFIFPFVTCPAENVHDYNGLNSDYIVTPFYVGSSPDANALIQQVIDNGVRGFKSDMVWICDERQPAD